MTSTEEDLNIRVSTITAEIMFRINRYFFLLGLEDLSVEGTKFPKWIIKIYNFNTKYNNFLYLFLILSEFAGLYTQKSLSDKRRTDLFLFFIGHVILFIFCINISYYKDSVRILLHNLTTVLKQLHNDPKVERDMIKKGKIYSVIFISNLLMAMVLYGIQGIVAVLTSSGKFSPIITAWPDINQDGQLANAVRVGYFILWWIVIMRPCAIYLLVILIKICLSHQYKNLSSYFTNLNKIFEDGNLSQTEKELKYEKAFGVGIKMHSVTLWCVSLTQKTCNYVFSSQILLCVIFLVASFNQWVTQDRTLLNEFGLMATILQVFTTTGFIMWNAGDITFDAAYLPTAMFSSGWHNLQKQSSKCIRPLLVIAMNQGQKPVTLVALGTIELSYESFVTLIKTSYSVFTVMY